MPLSVHPSLFIVLNTEHIEVPKTTYELKNFSVLNTALSLIKEPHLDKEVYKHGVWDDAIRPAFKKEKKKNNSL